MSAHILVVDDDKEIANLVGIYLVNEGFHVTKAHDGKQAIQRFQEQPYQLVILDVMMPEMDGLEVCRVIREEAGTPILMLSAKGEDMDKIMGLLTGADDYMSKPFNPLELIARVKSLLRRSLQLNAQLNQMLEPDTITVKSVEINKSTHLVTVHGRNVNLTSTEFDILYLLASHAGKVFSAEEIFERVWKDKYLDSNNTVMVHISKLRDKLENEAEGGKLIHTVWGVGYKIEK